MFKNLPAAGRALQAAFTVLACLLLVLESSGVSIAGTTGTISGTVVESVSHHPVAGVLVTASAPSGSYNATTDQRGFYVIPGMYSDTYTLTFQGKGFEPVSLAGVSVFADQTTTQNASLSKTLREIGNVTARSASGAFQPGRTTDTYNISAQQIQQINGNALNLSESNLISSLPGGSFDSSGYPVIRGGRENEENFEFEGIPYTDAFTSQFTNTLAAPGLGLQSIQLTPGVGDPSQDNYGTGTFNLVAKRGTYPGFATAQFAVGGPNFRHALNVEYGFATPNGKISNYMTLAAGNRSSAYGPDGVSTNANSIGTFFSRKYQTDREFIDNFVYRFGPNNNQAAQLFLDIADHHFYNGNGGTSQFCFKTCDPLFINGVMSLNGLVQQPNLALAASTPNAQIIQTLLHLQYGQTSAYQLLGNREISSNFQPNIAYKLGYQWNINPTTFLTAMAYHTNSVTTFDRVDSGGYSTFGYTGYFLQQGGTTSGGKLDITKQFSEKHEVKAGVAYRFNHPVFDYVNNEWGLLNLSGALGVGNNELFDFLTPAQCNALSFLSATRKAIICPAAGYVFNPANALPGGSAVPAGTIPPTGYENSQLQRQDYTTYVSDTWTPNARIKVNYGVRLDWANVLFPTPQIDPFTCTSLYYPNYVRDAGGNIQYTPSTNPNARTTDPQTGALGPLGMCPQATFNLTNAERRPFIPQPVISVAYRMGDNDALRASYGRSIQYPPLADMDATASAAYFSQFAGLRGWATTCGVLADQACATYAEQLRWDNARGVSGNPPIQPVRPTTFTNFDLSYSHNFTKGFLRGTSARLTPFFRKAHDEVALVNSPLIVNGVLQTDPITGNPLFGPSVASNKGLNQITGVEMQITKESPTGLSGQISMTYQNEFSSVYPLTGGEDFFPSIPAASLALGNVYRVGFLSPFVASIDLAYTTKSGIRINPQIQYNIGYPNSPGLLAAAYVNGKPYNIPNTNASGGITFVPGGTTQYVDPMNPGSLFVPNIDATRGIDAKNVNGAVLSHPSSQTNLTIEYVANPKAVVGLQIFNVFNALYGGAAYNTRYQPLATGISGPQTGTTSTAWTLGPQYGVANFGLNRRGNQPYLDTQNGLRSFYFYTTLKL